MSTHACERNKYLGAYDKPILRDKMLWVLIGLIIFGFVALLSPNEGAERSTGIPLWLDSLLGALVVGATIGYPLALVRRVIRLFVSRRSGHLSSNSDLIHNHTPLETFSDIPRSVRENGGGYTTPRPILPVDPVVKQNSLAGNLVADSASLSRAREGLPFPIARTARSLQISHNPIEQYTLLLELAESISVSVGAVAAAWLIRNEPDNPQLQSLYQAMSRGVSQGTWHSVIAAAAKSMANSESAIPGYCQGVGQSKKSPDLVSILRGVVEERNRWAHGARPTTKGDAAIRINDILEKLDIALRKISFLGHSPWILVRDTSYDRRSGQFVANVGKAMSDHPEFEPSTIRTSTPLAEDTLYVDAKGIYIDLTPLVVYKYCVHCRQPEMFYADRLDRGRAVLKSFARGHETFDEEIFEEFQDIMNRPAG
ncbi:hypothetical protein [Rhodococcus koreensis]